MPFFSLPLCSPRGCCDRAACLQPVLPRAIFCPCVLFYVFCVRLLFLPLSVCCLFWILKSNKRPAQMAQGGRCAAGCGPGALGREADDTRAGDSGHEVCVCGEAADCAQSCFS